MPVKRVLSDERLADLHHRRVTGGGIARTAVGVFFLSVFGLVVVIPFIYMALISVKTTPEIGNGRLLPEALRALGTLGRRDIVWIQARLSDDQAARLTGALRVPAAPATGAPPDGGTPATLPGGAANTRMVGLSKDNAASTEVVAVVEVRDPDGAFRAAGAAALYIPGEAEDSWQPVAAAAVPRSLGTLLSRLFVNYTALVDWPTLRAGDLGKWLSTGYPRWYLNSLFVAIATVLLGVFFDSLAGFAFAKFDFPMRHALFLLLLATIMIPYPVTLVPSFFLFAKMGFYNTYAALVVPGLTSAFGIFLVRQYVQTIPNDMLDAGRVDGAGDFRVYWHIVLPTAQPVLAALAVFRFIWQWNSYLYPLVLTNRDSMKTVQLGLATMQDAYGTVNHGLQMAGATLAVIPILGVYAFLQKHFVSGITMGAVKE
jgi:cellobiose transport system permease protein